LSIDIFEKDSRINLYQSMATQFIIKQKKEQGYRDETICIGGIFPLTGYLSWLGIYKKKASELKVDLINNAGGIDGRMLKLVIYDDCSSEEQATKAAEELIYKHRASALIGTGSLPVSLAVARIANRNRIPAFLNSGYTIDPVKDLFIFNTAHKTEFALACAFQYFSEIEISKISLLMPYGPLGDVGSWLAKHLANLFNIRIVGEERFDLSSFDIRSQLERIKELRPQAVFSFVTGRPAAWVAGNMANMGFKIPLLISHGNATPSFLKMISSIPLKVIVPSGKSMALDSMTLDDPSIRKIMDFNALHMARFNEPVNYYSAEQADAIDLIVTAFRLTGGRPDGLKDAIESIKNFVGMQGIYNLSNIDHYGTRPESMVLLSVRDGRWYLERSFLPLTSFSHIYDDTSKGLVHRLAGILLAPSASLDKKYEKDHILLKTSIMEEDAKATRIDYDFFRDYYSYKKELIKALYEEDEIKARQNLYCLLLYSLNMDEDESFRGMILEIFCIFCDTAIEKGVDIEKIAEFRKVFMEKWQTIRERDRLCLVLIRALYYTIEMITRIEFADSGLFKKVMSYIKNHYNENLNVERVARHVCLSPSYLIHRLKKQFGMNLTECIAMVRIENAKALLKSTNTSIGEIAHEVGYQDQCYFTKVFKKYAGCTPKEYRKSPVRHIPFR